MLSILTNAASLRRIFIFANVHKTYYAQSKTTTALMINFVEVINVFFYFKHFPIGLALFKQIIYQLRSIDILQHIKFQFSKIIFFLSIAKAYQIWQRSRVLWQTLCYMFLYKRSIFLMSPLFILVLWSKTNTFYNQ